MLLISPALSSRISTLSFICACMVVLIHVPVPTEVGSYGWFLSSSLSYGVCLIAVPFFFITSGFFLGRHVGEENWYQNALKKRLVSLLIPYLIFNAIYWGVTHLDVNTWAPRNVVYGLWGDPCGYPSLGPTWYIRSLIVYVLITPLLPCSRKYAGGGYVIAAVFLCMFEAYPESNLLKFLKYTCSLQNLFYFHIGLIIGKNGFYSISRKWAVIAAVVALLILIFKVFIEFKGFAVPTVWRLIFCPLTLIAFWKLFPEIKINSNIARMSFPIFLVHYFSILILNRLDIDYNRAVEFVGCYTFMICCSLLICVIIKKVLPKRITSVMFGGR